MSMGNGLWKVVAAATITAAVWGAWASPPRPAGADLTEAWAALALEFRIDVNDIAYHARRFPHDGRRFYESFVTRRVCVFYDEHRFPDAAFRAGARNFFGPGMPHVEGAVKVLSAHDPTAGGMARRLSEGKDLTEAEWGKFKTAVDGFYRTRSLRWNTMQDDLLSAMKTDVIGVLEHVVLKEPMPSVPVRVVDRRSHVLVQAPTNASGRFQLTLPYGAQLSPTFISAGHSEDDLESVRGMMPFGRRMTFSRAANSHILPLAHIGEVAHVQVTVTDAATRLPIPDARITVVQDTFEQRLAPVTEEGLDKGAAEAVLYGGLQTFQTDEFGNARFYVYAGTNTFRVEREGYPPHGVSVIVGAGADISKPVWVSMRKDRRPVVLWVKDTKNNPVRFARVHMEGQGTFLADDQGRILTSAAPEDSPLKFHLDMAGYAPGTLTVEPNKNGPTEATLTAEPAKLVILGHARDTWGRPLPGAMAFSTTTGDVGAADAEGEFQISIIPEKDAVVFVGKEGYLTQSVRPYLGAYWIMGQRIFYMGDVILYADVEGAPRIEAPSEGAYVAPEALAFDIRFPMHAGRAWGDGELSVGGHKERTPFDHRFRYVWKQPLSEGEHVAVFETALVDGATGQRRALRVQRKFHVGLPSWMESISTEPGGATGQTVVVKIRKNAAPPSMVETMRIFVADQILTYVREETDGRVVLRAEAPPVVTTVRLSAYDENGRLVEFFR